MTNLSTEEFIQELNRLFAEEVEAAMRYLHLLNAVSGMDRLIVESKLREDYDETIQHAQVIARKIRALGGIPSLQINLSCPSKPIRAREALETALTFREAALEAYQEVLVKVEGDVPLEEFIRSQIAVESEHVAELKQLLVE